VVDDGPFNTYQLSSATPPNPMGGTVVSGTYDSTLVTNYWTSSPCADAGMPQGSTGKYVVSASSATAGTIEFVAGDSSGPLVRESIRYAAAGSNLTWTIDCGVFTTLPDAAVVSGGSATVGYTATATQLLLISTTMCGTTVDTLTKR
jgi:hypothetical protein